MNRIKPGVANRQPSVDVVVHKIKLEKERGLELGFQFDINNEGKTN